MVATAGGAPKADTLTTVALPGEEASRQAAIINTAKRTSRVYGRLVDSFEDLVRRLPDEHARRSRSASIARSQGAFAAYGRALEALPSGAPLDVAHRYTLREAVRIFEALAFELAELCVAFPDALGSFGDQTLFEALSARTIALASRQARGLAPQPTPEETARSNSNAENQRRYRARKRARVAKRVRVNVHDGDLELLRQLGFLTAGQKDDDTAVAEALEAFLLNCFLGTPAAASGAKWRERVAAQRARLEILRDGKG